MRRLPLRAAAKRVPWVRALAAFEILKASWDELTPSERRRVRSLLEKSRGRPRNLTPSERDELVRLARRCLRAGVGARHRPRRRR